MYGLQFIRRVLYKLKLRYGEQIDLYTDGRTVDRDTGQQSGSLTKKSVARAIPLDAKNIYKFAQMGISPAGVFDLSTRAFLIDAADATPDVSQWLVYGGRKYEIMSVEALSFNACYLLICKSTTNGVFPQVYDETVIHMIGLDHE